MACSESPRPKRKRRTTPSKAHKRPRPSVKTSRWTIGILSKRRKRICRKRSKISRALISRTACSRHVATGYSSIADNSKRFPIISRSSTLEMSLKRLFHLRRRRKPRPKRKRKVKRKKKRVRLKTRKPKKAPQLTMMVVTSFSKSDPAKLSRSLTSSTKTTLVSGRTVTKATTRSSNMTVRWLAKK